jgi:hypothetical protein
MTARKLLLATLGIALFVGAGAAQARPRPAGHIAGRRFEANKTFGLGLELGAPFGLTGKYFLSSDRALDFGIGDIYGYSNHYGLHLYGDYLWHPVSLAATEDFELPLFFGVGGRFWSFEDRSTTPFNSASAFGIRVPVGVSFDLNNLPLDFFVQVVPVLDFYSNYRPHTVYLDVDASIGARYWFN